MGLPRYLKEKDESDFIAAMYGIKNSIAFQDLLEMYNTLCIDSKGNELGNLKLVWNKYYISELTFKNKDSMRQKIRDNTKKTYRLGKHSLYKRFDDSSQIEYRICRKFERIGDRIICIVSDKTHFMNRERLDRLKKLGYVFQRAPIEDIFTVVSPIKYQCYRALKELIDSRIARRNILQKINKYKERVFISRAYPITLRQLIFERDNYTCQCCGITKDNAMEKGLHLEVDHIVEWEDGGETTYENGQTLCSQCNKAKHRVKRLKTA